MTVLFKLEEASADSKGFAWASGFGALPTGTSFLHPTEQALMDRFWKVNPMRPGMTIDPGGRNWPDFLGHGGSAPSFFTCERVVESLRSIGAPMGRITEMPIADIDAKVLKSKPAPKYYVIETIPGIEVDLVATGFKLDAQGKAIVNPAPNPWPSPYRYRLDSWNETDLFAYRHFGPNDGPYIDMLCTERVKELAEKEGWTNVRFKPLELV